MSRPEASRRRLALATLGLASAVGAGGWATARHNSRASARRRTESDAGRPLEVLGSGGGRLHARVHGTSDAPTVVLIHGWTETSELWHKQVSDLAGELRLVTYDQRGHGLSDPAPDGDYSLAALARDLDAVLAAGVPAGSKPILCGHSMGAMVIAAWADALPLPVSEKARGAVLLSTGLDTLTKEAQLVRTLPGPFSTVQGKLADVVLQAPVSIQGTPLPIARLGIEYIAFAPGADRADVDLTAQMALDCRTRARAGCGHAMARMDLLHALDDLTIPAIVVAGARDRMTPIAHAERIERALPRSLGLRVDPDAGHMTPFESPELVRDAIREVVAATTAGAPEARLAA